jgi:hypothetical protein
MRDGKNPFRDLEFNKICYDYLYLDDCEALNALSSAAGGIEGDSTIELTKSPGGSAGLKFSLWGVGFDLTGSGSRAQRRQFVNRLTIHSQMAKLFANTEAGVAEVKDDGQVSWLKEGYLVRLDGFIMPLPNSASIVTSQDSKPHRADSSPFRQWIQRIIFWYNPESKERNRRRTMIGDTRFIGLTKVVDSSGNLGPRFVALELTADYVMVARKEDFARRATVFGWVVCVPREELYDLAIETKSGKPDIEVRYKTLGALVSVNNDTTEEVADNGRDDHQDVTPQASASVSDAVAAVQPLEPIKLAAWVRPICIYR